MQSRGTARISPPHKYDGFTFVPTNIRMSPACDCANLGSKPRQKTNQIIPPVIKFSSASAPVFSELSQGLQPHL